jgi:hypothetical protein
LSLAELREEVGDEDGAATLYRQAVDHHGIMGLLCLARLWRLWLYGLDPDGTPTLRWQ